MDRDDATGRDTGSWRVCLGPHEDGRGNYDAPARPTVDLLMAIAP